MTYKPVYALSARDCKDNNPCLLWPFSLAGAGRGVFPAGVPGCGQIVPGRVFLFLPSLGASRVVARLAVVGPQGFLLSLVAPKGRE